MPNTAAKNNPSPKGHDIGNSSILRHLPEWCQPIAAMDLLQRREFLSNAGNDTPVLRGRSFGEKCLEAGARARPVACHLIKKAEIHVYLHQIGIELRGPLEVAACGVASLLWNRDQSHAVLRGRVIAVVGENPLEDTLRVGQAALLEIGGGEVILDRKSVV